VSRDPVDLLADMREACDQAFGHARRGGEAWFRDALFLDAVIRNLEVLGEATKRVPPEVRAQHPKVSWRDAARMRDVLATATFGSTR
jgi:uncharacterized protein with HEPN domain